MPSTQQQQNNGLKYQNLPFEINAPGNCLGQSSALMKLLKPVGIIGYYLFPSTKLWKPLMTPSSEMVNSLEAGIPS